MRDIYSGIRAVCFNKKCTEYGTIFGNYLIIEHKGYFSLLAHIKRNSILVEVGEQVFKEQTLAKVGHNGSSKLPHLHFQLMDNRDLSKAKDLPVCFDLLHNEEKQKSIIPQRGEQVISKT